MVRDGKRPMQQTNKRLKKFTVLGLLLLTLAASYAVVLSRQIRCQLVHWSNLKKVNSSLFVDPDMSRQQVSQIVQMTIEARQRVAQFYGNLEANPLIIAGQDEKVIGKYARSGNRTATTYLYLGEAYVILGPDGLNVDVIAHELMHAELSERIGFLRREFKIPTWFDSGLAMQADYRESYSEEEWQKKTEGGKLAPSLKHLTSEKEFYTSDYWVNYATAKHEVGRWFAIVGSQGLADFLTRIKSEKFTEAYESIERERVGQKIHNHIDSIE
jgi:hypothetical protein